jgi:hypothetical protein
MRGEGEGTKMGRIDKVERNAIKAAGSIEKEIFKPESDKGGSLDDRFGTINTAWRSSIPLHADGSVDLAYSGFIRTGKGTSCASCKHYLKGHCMKITGYPEILSTDCCNFYEMNR